MCGLGQPRASVEHLDYDACICGPLKNAPLILKGKLLYGLLKFQSDHEPLMKFFPDLAAAYLDCNGAERRIHNVELDNHCTVSPFSAQVLCIAVLEDSYKENRWGIMWSWRLGVLILQQRSTGSLYKRIVILFLQEQHCDFYNANETPEKYNITTI